MAERVYKDPEIGDVRFVRSSRGRRVSIRVHPLQGVRVSVPWLTSYETALGFFLSKRDWVLKVMARQKAAVGDTGPVSDERVALLARHAAAYLPERLAFLAGKYGFRYRRLSLKNNVSNWGSCSAKGNINLNVRLMMLPEYLRDYVILHELSHLVHQNHSPQFHALLERLCADHFAGQLPAGLVLSRSSGYPVSHALETEMKKHHTTYGQ